MTTARFKAHKKSALTRPVFLIVLVITLLLAPASVFADDDSPESDSSPTVEQTGSTDQSGGFEAPAPADSYDSPVDQSGDFEAPEPAETVNNPLDSEQDPTADFSADTAGVNPGATDPDTGPGGAENTESSDSTAPEQELAPPEAASGTSNDADSSGETEPTATYPQAGETDPSGYTLPTSETETPKTYFQVAEVSMSPLLNPGAIIEIVSETYADGDMVVAQTSDGTYIVKMLDGDQLVPLGAGVSYTVADVTILGAAVLSAMTQAELESSGIVWHTALATTSTPPASGNGDPDNPYQIAIWQNLYWLSQTSSVWDKHFIQTADIEFPGDHIAKTDGIYDWDNDNNGFFEGWTPIGNGDVFHGTYSGNGYTISNLYINRPSENHIGLFGYTGSNAVLQDISLGDVDITGYQYVGGLIGLKNGTINNCNVSGEVKGYQYIGGLVGKDDGGTINKSYSTAKVTGNGSYVGGLVGQNLYGTISNNSYATGEVTGFSYVGGLVGINKSTIVNSYATGSVTGTNYVGGLVGDNDFGEIKNCYVTGTVNGTDHVGGLAGSNYKGTISNCYADANVTGSDEDTGGLVGYNNGTISNCYAIGTVEGFWAVGGLVGYNNSETGIIENSYAAGSVTCTDPTDKIVGGLVGQGSGSVTSSYYDSQTTGQRDNTGKGEPKTTAEMKTLATYVGWEIAGQDGSYPILGWQVGWTDNIWYMGTPPAPDNTNGGNFGGDFGLFDFGFPEGAALLAQNGFGLTTITGQGNAPISPSVIAYGSWNDLYQASAAYQAALARFENNGDTLSPAELALLEVELAMAKAALLAMEARLLAADGLPYNLAALQAAYATAVATLSAQQGYLSADQQAAANQLLAAIAGIIAALQFGVT